MRVLAACAALMLTAAAPAPVEVVDARFFAERLGDDGMPAFTETTAIPFVPNTSCYRWALAIKPGAGVRAIRERFTLPAAPESWGGVDENPESATRVAASRKVAETDLMVPLARGEISNGWCVAEGDPQGPHLIEIFDGERLLHRFEFTVGEAEAF